MHRRLATVIALSTLAFAPAHLHGQDLVSARVDARLEMPQFLLVDVIEHVATSQRAGRLVLAIRANQTWNLTLRARNPDVVYRIVPDSVSDPLQGPPGSHRRVVVEYTWRGVVPQTHADTPIDFALTPRQAHIAQLRH